MNPPAPDIVRYAVLHGVRFSVAEWSVRAEQTLQTDASDAAMWLISGNQINVLRVLTGEYYAGQRAAVQ
ncbi:MAG: hypothetical protein NT024_00425 [Proteobacteria bacterium]|nr:hypothetical protein [Pseudomonadota bacterium]